MQLSIITINYNNLIGLRKTAESVISQSYHDYEWIVIDGGSKDGSKDYIEKHKNSISFWCSEQDKGIYNAMNKGIEKACGQYILFLNSGDVLYNEDTLRNIFYSSKYSAIDYSDADILYGDAFLNYAKHSRRWVYDDVLTLKKLYKYSINHQSAFIRTSLLKEQGYDESYKIAADWKRFTEWLIEGRRFKHLPIIVSCYDTNGISTRNVDLAHKERDRFFAEFYPQEVIDVLKDWVTFQNKPCLETRQFCNENKLFKRLIRSNLHFITWLKKIIN